MHVCGVRPGVFNINDLISFPVPLPISYCYSHFPEGTRTSGAVDTVVASPRFSPQNQHTHPPASANFGCWQLQVAFLPRSCLWLQGTTSCKGTPLPGGLSIPALEVQTPQRGNISMRSYRLPGNVTLWLLPDCFELLELRDHQQGEESPHWQKTWTPIVRRRHGCVAQDQEQRKTRAMLTIPTGASLCPMPSFTGTWTRQTVTQLRPFTVESCVSTRNAL